MLDSIFEMNSTVSTPINIVFEDGSYFPGSAFTKFDPVFGEVVFNTAMTGYQEVLTDPSYAGQIVTMTYPHIGSYGINVEDEESSSIHLSAMVMKAYHPIPSNWRSTQPLKEYLESHNIVGIDGVDTRALTKFTRENGALRAVIAPADDSVESWAEKAKQHPSLEGLNLADTVTCSAPYVLPAENIQYKVAVVDCGIKQNILRHLTALGCECHVFPSTVSYQQLADLNPDGVFISNGPGDPAAVKNVVDVIRQSLGNYPLFGICLGHQMLGLALGQSTYKLKFGHHGANHPIKQLKTGKVEVTSQNHGFCIDPDSIDADEVEVTHINLNDKTIAGIAHKKYPAFSVQYHPEAAPGPQDSHYLFTQFTELMATHAV